nr:unnamed protein product [Digitaria exilis]
MLGSKKTKSTSKGPNQALNHLSPRLLAPPCLLAKAGEGGRGRGAAAPARACLRRPSQGPAELDQGRRRRCTTCCSASRSSTRGGGGAARPAAQPRGARPGEVFDLLLGLAPRSSSRGSREGDAGDGDGD